MPGDELRTLSESGHPESQYRLGLRCLQAGDSEGIGWLVRASQQGHAEAQRELGERFLDGRGLPEADPARGVGLLEQAAQRGLHSAQVRLARCYAEGIGRAVDAAAWRRWAEAAALAGDVEAALLLGVGYLEGRPVDTDLAEAERWLRSAADRDHAGARLQLGRLLLRDGRDGRAEEGVECLRRAAAARLPDAMLELARCYADGRGVARDMTAALSCYRAAAPFGISEAEYQVGVFAETGVGAPPNLNEALLWYGRAADRGHPFAAARRAAIVERVRKLLRPESDGKPQ